MAVFQTDSRDLRRRLNVFKVMTLGSTIMASLDLTQLFLIPGLIQPMSIINRDLLDNITKPATEHVIVADGSAHPIEASGTLLGHPSIHADYVLTFTHNLVGVSPIIDSGPVGIIQ